MIFGPKNKGPVESRTSTYVHKNRPIVDVAQQLNMKTEFNFQKNPWTVTYSGTPTQWGKLLAARPNAIKSLPNNTRKANNRVATVAQRKTRSRRH